MKRTFILVICAILAILSGSYALASDTFDAIYTGTVRVTNNSTATGYVSVNISNANSNSFIDGGYMFDSCNNTAIVYSAGADAAFMPGYDDNPWVVFVESIGANALQNDILYMGGTTNMNAKWRYFPGLLGMIVNDSASLEFVDNTTISIEGFINTDNATDKYLFNKENSIATYVSNTVSENVTAAIISGATANLTVTDNSTPLDIALTSPPNQSHFLMVDDPPGTPDDGATYVREFNAGSAIDVYELSNATGTIPVNAVIYSVNVTFRCLDSAAAADLAAPIIVLGADNTTGTTQTLANAWTTYTEELACPDGTGVWSFNKLDNLEVGIYLEEVGADGEAQCTQVFVAVSYGVPDAEISAINVTSDEHIIKTSIDDTPDFDTWASDAQIAVNMGASLIPAVLLEEQELTGTASSVTFSNIDDLIDIYESATGLTARHLLVYVNAASPDAVTHRNGYLRLNGDSGNNYNVQTIDGQNAAASAARYTSQPQFFIFGIPGTTYANSFGGGTILIPNAFNTTNHKSIIAYGGAVEERVRAISGRWADISAVTSATLSLNTGDFDTGSVFQLLVVDERYLVEEDYNPTADFLPDFNGIDGSGNDLVCISYARTDNGGGADRIRYDLNGDAVDANYNTQILRGFGAATQAATANNRIFSYIADDGSGANQFGVFIHFISQYAETTNDPSSLAMGGFHESGGNSDTWIASSRRNNIATITRLQYSPVTGANFKAGSLFSLYRVPRHEIARVELTGTDNITLSNIPQTYSALQLIVYARTDRAFAQDSANITINSDTTTNNYDHQKLSGAAAVVTATRSTGSLQTIDMSGNTAGANEFSGGVITFHEYYKNDRHKHFTSIAGVNEDYVCIYSFRWEDISPITDIYLTPRNGTGFLAGSIFELIGIMPLRSFFIDVDDEIKAITDATADNTTLTAANNANDWQFFTNDAMPYIETANVTVNGTLTGSWLWEYAATFTDGSGYGNTATPTFRTTNSNPDVSAELLSFGPIDEAKAPGYTVNISTTGWITDNISQSGNFTTTSTNATYPGSDVISAVTTAGAVPTLLLELILACMAILSLSLFVSWMMKRNREGSLIFKITVIGGGLGIMIAIHIIDDWILWLFLMLSIALAMAASQRSFEGTGNTGNNMIGFLAMAFVGMTTINRILEGRLIQTSDVTIIRNVLAFQPFNVYGIFTIPVPNTGFLTNGIPAMLRWDYSYFGGNAQFFEYLLYSITAVVSFMLFVLVFGAIYQMFSRG